MLQATFECLCLRASCRRAQVIQWKGRIRHGSQSEREQRSLVIVASDAIGFQRATPGAAVHERPLPVLADLDRDGLHRAPAWVSPITRLVVEVTRPEAAGAVVAMGGAKAACFDNMLADDAGERRFNVSFVRHG